jgi:hypothetical protein
MRIEMRRLQGEKALESFDWVPSESVSADEIREMAKRWLMGCHGQTETNFWPLAKFKGNAPEAVWVLDQSGGVITKYSLDDLIRDTGKALVGIPVGEGDPRSTRP